MELNQELVRLGRALGHLPIKEDDLQRELVQDRGGLVDRVSFLHGVIEGKALAGDFDKVIEFGSKCPGKGMILDKEAYHEKILEAARNHGDKSVYSVFTEPLWEAQEFDLLTKLTLILPMSYETSDSMFAKLRPHMTPAQKKESHSALGRRAMDSSEHLKYAAEHFEKAEDEEAIEGLYQKLLTENPVGFRKTLIRLAKRTNTKAERFLAIVEQNLADKDSSKYEFKATDLFKFVEEEKIPLGEAQLSDLRTRMITSWGHHDLSERDPQYHVEWAQLHATESPKEAYQILQTIEGTDAPRLDALEQGLRIYEHSHGHNKDWKGIAMKEALPEDLESVYDRFAPIFSDDEENDSRYEDTNKLRIQENIAVCLKDNEKLKNVARGYARLGNDRWAYNAWVKSGADLGDRFIMDVKYRLIAENDHEVGISFLAAHDKQGWGEALMHARINNLHHASYQICWMSQNQKGLVVARKKLIKQDPISALQRFQNIHYLIDEQDTIGIDMALDVLATKYEVLKDQLLGYFAQPEPVKQ